MLIMFKLLKKSEIDIAKARDRQREINEGMKIAHRVDTLRKTQAEEEAILERFRLGTISKINEEIVSRTKELNVLLKQVSDLEDKRRIALQPLDTEWNEVNQKKDELTYYALSLNNEKSTIKELRKGYEVEVELLETEKKRILSERDQSIKSLYQAEENKEKSRNTLKESENIKKSIIDLKDNVMRELKERDTICASKERDLENKEEQIEKEKKALDRLKIKLLDQRATLERAMARLKKK